MQEQSTSTNQINETSEQILPQPESQNQGAQPQQNVTIALPKREHSVKTVISTLSNGAVVVGTGLGLFNHYGAQIAGTVCKGVGFGLNQICDGLKNHDARKKVGDTYRDFSIIRDTKMGGNTINLEPLSWKDRYGINQTRCDRVTNIIITMANTLFQLLACGFLIGRFINEIANQTDSKTDVDWSMVGLNLAFATFAFVFDKYEQHIKQDNLQRYQVQLKEGIAELDKLPDSLSSASRPQQQ